MLRTYSNNISVTASSPIPFNNDKIKTGTEITHPSASVIQVNKPGYYKITVDASYSGAAGLASIQLYANNVAIPDAIISTTLVADSVSNGSFTTILKANIGALGDSINLTVLPTVDLTISNIALNINRA